MKIRDFYRLFLLCSLAFLTSATAVSQTMMQPEPTQQMEETARQQTAIWENELSLTGKQMVLVEKKFVEFAIKRDRILQSKMREEVKTRHLLALEELENREMRDILTKPQYDRYLRLKKRMDKKEKRKTNRRAENQQ